MSLPYKSVSAETDSQSLDVSYSIAFRPCIPTNLHHVSLTAALTWPKPLGLYMLSVIQLTAVSRLHPLDNTYRANDDAGSHRRYLDPPHVCYLQQKPGGISNNDNNRRCKRMHVTGKTYLFDIQMGRDHNVQY